MWSTAHGDFLSVTGLTGRQISRLGAHFDPIVAAFAPLWWLWPDPRSSSSSQAVAVATGAVPVYLLGRRHLGSEWAAAGFALAYLLHPATQWLVLDDFHPVALATPLLLWAFWFLDSDRLLPFAVTAGARVPDEGADRARRRRDGPLVRAPARAAPGGPRDRRRRHRSSRSSRSPSSSRTSPPAAAPRSRAATRPSAGRRPGSSRPPSPTPARSSPRRATGRDLAYLLDLLLPLLGLPLLAPLAALTAAPSSLLNLLSDTRTQTSIHFHYTAGAIPA